MKLKGHKFSFLSCCRNICWAQWLLLAVFLLIFLSACGGEDQAQEADERNNHEDDRGGSG